MGRVYGYKNQLWRETHRFEYSGEPKSFTLTPGRYLLMCHGAHGGTSLTNLINYGGVSYGVLNLTETTTMYAVVGGNGGDGMKGTAGAGGYNGGGNGGLAYNANYVSGSGGGGASDIRLTLDKEIIDEYSMPPEYTELEFIQTDAEHTAWIDTEYLLNGSSELEVYCEPSSTYSESWSCLFGTDDVWCFDSKSSVYTNRYCYFFNHYGYHITNSIYNEPVLIKVYNDRVDCYRNEELFASSYPPGPIQNLNIVQTMTIFCSRNDQGVTRERSHAKMFYFKIYEGGELIHYFVPCKDSDDKCGLYDIIQQKFHGCPDDDRSFIAGNEVPDQDRTIYRTYFDRPIYTRIIVAGGGGGCAMLGNTYYDHSGIGGGSVGGFVDCNVTIPENQKYADQMSGYHFAKGDSASNKTSIASNGAEGASGGGGGWYGGYAVHTNGTYSSANGGGGSGYVLTADSYKPEGYEVDEKFYLTDTYMGGGYADEPFVSVCELISDILPGDEIVFYPTGESVSIPFPPGKYRLKCWGGSGGCRKILSQAAVGGYAEGLLDMHSTNVFHVHVGSPGLYDSMISNEYVHQIRPDINYNGGGLPNEYGVVTPNGHSGGGASDIRIGSDSVYARVIVAGGAGGMGSGVGGAGGGETGVSGSGSYGTTPGPGKQKESPNDPIHPTINGGFGYGGNADRYLDTSGVGGAGGGGWYGGSGTYPTDGYDRHRGGCGGSGYVLTDESYKPDEYLLDEEFHLTETKLIQGGNDLHIGQTRVMIDVLDISNLKILCRDAQGIKSYSSVENKWILTPIQTLNTSLFEQYGVINIPTDDGLLDDFEILTWDPNDAINVVDVNVVPNKQIITNKTKTNIGIKKVFFDLKYDVDHYKIDLNVERKSNGADTTVLTTVEIDKLSDADSVPKIFYSSYLSK